MASTRAASIFLRSIRQEPLRIANRAVLRPFISIPRSFQPAPRRLAHTIPRPPAPSTPASNDAPSPDAPQKPRKLQEPHYELTFTCVPCGTRSTHGISKQGYHKGSVLITCPSCRNRHVISDHLNIFGDRKMTIEDLMREKGQLVKRGTLGEDGDVEFWEDGSVTERGPGIGVHPPVEPAAAEEDADEAALMRETRDPSAAAATANPSPSAPLTAGGSRPTIDSASQHDAVPSTRREFSTSRI